MNPSPLWYRMRGTMILLIVFLSFQLAYGLSTYFHQPTQPTAWQLAAHSYARFRAILAIGAFFAIVAFLMRIWGAAYLRAAIVWARDASATQLIVAGPFRYVRNPLYLGNLLALPWIALFIPPVGISILAVGTILFLAALSRYEGEILHRRFATEYERYAQQVPALVPRLFPIAEDPLAPKADWREGLRSELFMLSFAIVAVLFAIDPKLIELQWIWVIPFVAFVAQWLFTRARDR